jgi:hypothetical protein
MKLRMVLVLCAALLLTIGFVSTAGGSPAQKPNKGFVKAQAYVRSQATGVWKDPLPAACEGFLKPKAACAFSYKGVTLLPRGIVITPGDSSSNPWLPLSLEILEATTVSVKQASPNICYYTASGTAMGPYPGTFTQTGTISPGEFTGTLTINSDAQTITAVLTGALPQLPCPLILERGGAFNGFYSANGDGVVDTPNGHFPWTDQGDTKVWLDWSHLSEAFRSHVDDEIASFATPTSPCPPEGCH